METNGTPTDTVVPERNRTLELKRLFEEFDDKHCEKFRDGTRMCRRCDVPVLPVPVRLVPTTAGQPVMEFTTWACPRRGPDHCNNFVGYANGVIEVVVPAP
ncbi:MAG: hypothetical protein RL681_398 [Candidatus Parcubacteria bacterium]